MTSLWFYRLSNDERAIRLQNKNIGEFVTELVKQAAGSIDAEFRDSVLRIRIAGDWGWREDLPSADPILAALAAETAPSRVEFDAAALHHWSSLLMVELIKLVNAAQARGVALDLAGLPDGVHGLLRLAQAVPERSDALRQGERLSLREWIWRQCDQGGQHLLEIVRFIGELALSLLAVKRGEASFRWSDFWLYAQECGPAALPIISLLSLLVGLILAFVGALELSLFGAEIYIANLVSLGMTREMGGLMTAIIMSGRTGAAFAAQLGTMQVNNEIDALKTMNLPPLAFLVLPRMLALIVTMPLLCLYSDLMGVVGGGLVSISLFDVSLQEYLDRASKAVHLADLGVGLVKCTVFGILIALAGCLRGMQCRGSAAAVGAAATSAVVTCLVFIVLSDSVMTIICNRLHI